MGWHGPCLALSYLSVGIRIFMGVCSLLISQALYFLAYIVGIQKFDGMTCRVKLCALYNKGSKIHARYSEVQFQVRRPGREGSKA